MGPKRQKQSVTKKADNRGWKDLTPEEVVCLICKNVLCEPIQLPCRCSTRMRCTMCRDCFVRMVSDDSSECRSCCPLCNVRLLNWMRRVTRDQTEYRSSIATDLWAEIQIQYKPYNPMGKEASDFSEITICRQVADRGEVEKEFKELSAQKRSEFLAEKQREEAENLQLLSSIEDPELQQEIRKQIEAEREMEAQKYRKMTELEDAELAMRLQEEESKLKKREMENRDHILAKKLDSKFNKRIKKTEKNPTLEKYFPKSLKRSSSSINRAAKICKYDPVVDLNVNRSVHGQTDDMDSTDSDRTPSPDWIMGCSSQSNISLSPNKPSSSQHKW